MPPLALSRKQGLVAHPEAPALSTWNLENLADRLDPSLTRFMPHGSSLVLAEPILRALAQVPDLTALGRIGLVHGPAGHGKSMLLGVIRAACPYRVAHVELRPNRSSKQADLEIYRALTGVTPDSARVTEDHIEALISVELTKTPTLIVLDEVQYLSTTTLQQFRRLSDSSYAPFGLLLAGVNVRNRLRDDTTLWTRIAFDVALGPLTGAALHRTLADFHPMLAGADPELLARIDKVRCGGNWRKWAMFIERAQRQGGRDVALTADIAKATLWTANRIRLNTEGLA